MKRRPRNSDKMPVAAVEVAVVTDDTPTLPPRVPATKKVASIITTRRQAAKAKQDQIIAESAKKEANKVMTRSRRMSKAVASKYGDKQQESHPDEEIIVTKEEPVVNEQTPVQVEKQPLVQVDKQPSVKVEKQPLVQVEKQLPVQVDKQLPVKAEKQLPVQVDKQPPVKAEKQPPVKVEKQPHITRMRTRKSLNAKLQLSSDVVHVQQTKPSATHSDNQSEESVSFNPSSDRSDSEAESTNLPQTLESDPGEIPNEDTVSSETEIIKVIEIVDESQNSVEEDDIKEYEVMYVEDLDDMPTTENSQDHDSELHEKNSDDQMDTDQEVLVSLDDSQESDEYFLVETSQDESDVANTDTENSETAQEQDITNVSIEYTTSEVIMDVVEPVMDSDENNDLISSDTNADESENDASMEVDTPILATCENQNHFDVDNVVVPLEVTNHKEKNIDLCNQNNKTDIEESNPIIDDHQTSNNCIIVESAETVTKPQDTQKCAELAEIKESCAIKHEQIILLTPDNTKTEMLNDNLLDVTAKLSEVNLVPQSAHSSQDTEKTAMVTESATFEAIENQNIEIKQEESKVDTELNIVLDLEKKLEDIKIDADKPQLSPQETKCEDVITENFARNVYAEAFAGLSSEARNHIYEALMRTTKAEVLPEKEKAPTELLPDSPIKKTKSNENDRKEKIRFDPVRNIFVTEDLSKKSKKSSKSRKKSPAREKESKKKKEKEKKKKEEEDDKEVRRSSRIQVISQTKKRSHGHGLVKDRDRFLKHGDDNGLKLLENGIGGEGKFDISTSNHDSSQENDLSTLIIQHDLKSRLVSAEEMLPETEMEERLRKFITIRDNIYHCDRNISKEAKKMTCDCFLTNDEIDRGELGCGEDCLNRLLMIECGPKCIVAERCTNRRFQKTQYAKCKVFRTEKKGFGIMADAVIPPGEFIMEYVGEVLNSNQFEKRADEYSKDKNIHYYFMALRSDAVIDATLKGNISRFINHSCDPNAETQKWTVNGELRIGFFSTRTILKGEELTFDYQFQRYGKEAQKCYCEASNCRGWIGEEPDSEEEIEEEIEEEVEEQVEETEEPKAVVTDEAIVTVSPEKDNADVSQVSVEPVGETVEDVPQTVLVKEATEVVEPPPKPTVTVKVVKVKRMKKVKKPRPEIFDDADLDDEIDDLTQTGLKNQVHTLKLSRLMVRAKQMEIRSKMLTLLQNGEMPCRRLFLDYHGLRLLYGWMCDSVSKENDMQYLKLQLSLLETLKALPIPNKTMLKDSKIFYIVQKWSQNKVSTESPNDDTPSDSGSGTPMQSENSSPTDRSVASIIINHDKKDITPENSSCSSDEAGVFIKKSIIDISLKLMLDWKNLPEVFRIPKKERIEQMKEHEREANLRYKSLGLPQEEPEKSKYDRYRERHQREKSEESNRGDKKMSRDICRGQHSSGHKRSHHLNKHQRRQIFEMKFAQEQQEKKKQEMWRLHEMKCRCFGLDARLISPDDVPAMVNPATGQWYTSDHRPVASPPSHAHIKPADPVLPTNAEDYNLPPLDLPPFWKYGITTKGRIFYYHTKIRISQWEVPIFLPPLELAADKKSELGDGIRNDDTEDKTLAASSSDDSGNSSEEELQEQIVSLKASFGKCGKNVPKVDISEEELHKCLKEIKLKLANIDITDSQALSQLDTGKFSSKRHKKKRKRRDGLVQERIIRPRTLEDRMYGQKQSKLYRETKEKLRKRKDEMRKRKMMDSEHHSSKKILKLTEGLPTVLVPVDDSPDSDENSADPSKPSRTNSLPSQPLDLENPEEFVETLISKSIEHDAKFLDDFKEISKDKAPKKNVYEEWKKQHAKLKLEQRKRELQKAGLSTGTKEIHLKKRKTGSDTDLSNEEARKIKEKFRTDIAGVIVQHLTPYRKESCKIGRIIADEDFKHLARKLTHFVMLKELKHCDNTVNILEVTDSVKIKSREFIKKYMAKYGSTYQRGDNEPEFRE